MNYDGNTDFRKVLMRLFSQWRRILAVMLIFAALFGLLGGFKQFRSVRAAIASTEADTKHEESVAEYESKLALLNNDLANKQNAAQLIPGEVEKINARISELEAYCSDSIYMNLVPEDMIVSAATVYIDADASMTAGDDFRNQSLLNSIVNAYAAVENDGALFEKIAQTLGLEEKASYLRELLSFDSVGNGKDYNMISSFSFKVYYPDKEIGKKMLDMIWEAVQAETAEIYSSIAPHTISLISSSVYTGADNGVAEHQNSILDELSGFYTDRDSEYKRLSLLYDDISTINGKIKALKEPVKASYSYKSCVKKAIIYAVVGAVFSFAVYAACAILFDSLSPKIGNGSEITGIGLRVISIEKSKKRRFSGVDRFFARLFGSGFKTVSENDGALMLAAHLSGLVVDGQKPSFLLTGTAPEEEISALAKLVSPSVSSGVGVDVAACALTNARTAEKLSACDGVILVEKGGRATVAEVEREFLLCESVGKEVKGIVVI